MAAAKKASKLLTKNTKLLERTSKMFDDVVDAGEEWAEDKIKELKLNKSAWSKLSNTEQVSQLSEAVGEATREAIAYNNVSAPTKLRSLPGGKAVDKQRLRELRKKYADQTKDFTRAGTSNFKGQNTDRVLEKEYKRYASKQYGKEKGRLEYLTENGSRQEKRSAKKQLNNLSEEDFLPKTKNNTPKSDINKGSFANKLVGYGVGGGLVLSLANNKGQQSNEQLYGQR